MLTSLLTSVVLASSSSDTPPATPASLGAERCADCHGDLVESYGASGMARALGEVDAEGLGGLGRVADTPAGLTYRFDVSGRRPRLVESWKAGADEARYTVRLGADLLFRIGAGLQDRSFAARRGETMAFAPVEVLSATADSPAHAALAPGAMMQSGTRFDTPITLECLACHTGELPPEDYPHDLVSPASWRPVGIGCAVCHAGADAHATWREAEADGARPEQADPILRHADLDLHQQLSLCARCHLQGDARVALEPSRRGISAPGVDHLEEWAVYLPANEDGDVAFVSQTERLLRSRCFEESRGEAPLTCTTCHDPHSSSTAPEEQRALRAACLRCHAEDPGDASMASSCGLPGAERTPGLDCVDCHMPRTRVFDVHGVTIRDHFIRARPEVKEPGPLRVKHCQDGLLRRFSWPGSPPPREDLGLSLMAAIIGGQAGTARDLVDVPPGEVAQALPTYHHLRGRLLEELGRTAEAIASYRRALALDPSSAETRVNLGLLLGTTGSATEALELLDSVLAEYPRAEGALRNRGIVKLGLGDEAGFAADLRAAHRIRPRGLLARALSAYYQKLGDVDEAQGWEREARSLDP